MLIRSLAIILAASITLSAAADPTVVWCEAEKFFETTKEIENAAADKLTASGGKVLAGAAFGKKDRATVYKITLPGVRPQAKMIFRYARLHWRDEMKPADIAVVVSAENKELYSGHVAFSETGGWGAVKSSDWGLVEVPVGDLPAAELTMTLKAAGENCDIVLDGFFLAPQDFKLTREELAGLSRLRIDSSGYVGISLPFPAIEQSSFAGAAISARFFVPTEKVLTAGLFDQVGKPVIMFYDKQILAASAGRSALPIPAAPIKILVDGDYVLSVSWDGGALATPFVALQKLKALAEQREPVYGAAGTAFAAGNKPDEQRCAADLTYARDYLTNALVMINAQSGKEAEETKKKTALAYFEKSRSRTAREFSRDLANIIAQSDETLARLKDGRDPYAGRVGDFRRAFVSETTTKLEPYRVFVPHSYATAASSPFILTLHGAGGDENYFPENDEGRFIATAEKLGYVFAAPRATSKYTGDGAKDLYQLVQLVQREYPAVDKARTYCTGVSMGGFGTYHMSVTYPDLFAASCCVSGNIRLPTGASYTTPATTTADSGATYSVVVTNAHGRVVSSPATLTVNSAPVSAAITTPPAKSTATAPATTGTTPTVSAPTGPPMITTQPTNQVVTAPATATLSVVAIGTPTPTYQWQRNGVDIPKVIIEDVKKLKTTPILIIHGGNDTAVLPDGAQALDAALAELGFAHELKIYPQAGHDYRGAEYLTFTHEFFKKYTKAK